jgi:hypothetical protein
MYSYFKTGRDVHTHTCLCPQQRQWSNSYESDCRHSLSVPRGLHQVGTTQISAEPSLVVLPAAATNFDKSEGVETRISASMYIYIWFVLGHACMNGYNLCGRSQERIKNMQGLRAFWWNKITACCLLGGLQAFQGCNEHVALACLSSLIDYVTRLWGYIYLSIFFIFRLVSAWNLCALTPVGS